MLSLFMPSQSLRFVLLAIMVVGAIGMANGRSAYALDAKVYSPQVVKGEAEIEYAGMHTFDKDSTKGNAQEHQFSLGYGITDFWKSEFYVAELEREPGGPQRFSGNEWENIFQFWPIGEYWVDAGLLASYHFSAQKDTSDSVEFKLLLQKDIGRVTTLMNVGVSRDVGSNAAPGNDLASAINARYRWLPYFEPGVEIQSDYGIVGDPTSYNTQEHYLGPIAYGKILPGLKYEVGYFRGISDAAATSAARVKLEYEIFF